MGKKWKTLLILLVVLLISNIVVSKSASQNSKNDIKSQIKIEKNEIPVGLLYSKTGTTAIVEKGMLNAAEMAFDEINQAGGINGKKIRYIEADYSSNPSLAKKEIKKLVEEDHVVATVGCYSSASRLATLSILEKNDSLLVYPTYTEGEELHPNVIYTGAMPNQQAMEYIPWLLKHCGKKVMLVGSNYVFPITSNKLAKQLIDNCGGTVCGEEYVQPGDIDFDNVWKVIDKEKPDFIYCDLIGDSVVSFYQQYAARGYRMEDCPIASITMDENTLESIGNTAEGSYSSMNYFSTLNTSASLNFIKKYRNYTNDNSQITCLTEASYYSCYLLGEALKKVDATGDTNALINAFSGLEYDSPQGKIRVDIKNHCTWMYSRFAKVEDGEFKIIYESDDMIKPEPFSRISNKNR